VAKASLEVADVFRRYGPAFRKAHRLSIAQRRVMRAIECCRTAALGGHVEKCERCGHTRISFNSCRNRHCTKCQSLAKARWLDAQQQHLLPCEYFHVVFTIPESIAAIAFQNRAVVFNILFRASAQALQSIARDRRHLGAEIGLLAVLHSWGQTVQFHPHIHCVVPGGGLSSDGQRWVPCRPGFFLPVKVLSRRFRTLFLTALQQAFRNGDLKFFSELKPLAERAKFAELLAWARRTEWVVYAKPPFGGPQQVLDYLGRYTHRVAISNNRLLSMEDGTVCFRWKDYRHSNRQKTMAITAEEFMRRFLLHVLPTGFVRIRRYGLLGNRHCAAKLAICRRLLGADEAKPQPNNRIEDYRIRYEALTGASLIACPVCQSGRMIRIETLSPTLGSSISRIDSS
jgi:hypothetical protein